MSDSCTSAPPDDSTMVAAHSVAATEALTTTTSPNTVSSTPQQTTQATRPEAPLYRDPICPFWTKCTQSLHTAISTGVTVCALSAVRNPKTHLAVISTLSLLLITVGLLTNFELILDLDQVLTPVNSKPQQHADWIYSNEGFPDQTRLLQMIFYNQGHNVLHVDQARRVLEAVETIRTTKGYDDLCAQGVYKNFDNEVTCRLFSVSGYWNDHSLEKFNATVTSDEALRTIVSGPEFDDGSPVLHDVIVGNYDRNNSNGVLTSAQSYLIRLELPDVDDTDGFETDMLGRLDNLRRDWMKRDQDKMRGDTTALAMDFVTVFAYQAEFLRAVVGDIYLVSLSAFLMVGFTCLVFYRRDPKESRSMLGLASVITICCSIMTGNGLMFVIGVPYSTMAQMLPFIIFGIGLDDTFIITGAYFRTDPQDPIEDRIRTTMQEVGWSISLTTLTTIFAFTLGYFSSSFPGVHWLCLSAVATITIDFYYQITYFVAFLVLDERRLEANRRDCCFWLELPDKEEESKESNHSGKCVDEDSEEPNDMEAEVLVEREVVVVAQSTPKLRSVKAPMPPDAPSKPGKGAEASDRSNVTSRAESEGQDRRTIPEKIMSWYADILLLPQTKAFVLAIFGLFFAVCCVSATKMTQEFNIGDYVTTDSFLRNIFTSLNDYSTVIRPVALYFRHVDQSDLDIQRQMIDYVEGMEALDQVWSVENMTLALEDQDSGFIGGEKIRPFCWVRDFQQLDLFFEDQPVVQAVFNNLTFNEKMDFLLTDKIIREVYGQDIVRDEAGNIVASRCYLFLQDLDLKDVEAQIDMLFDQRDVTLAQPINHEEEHQKDWAFFAYDELFGYWEAYSVSADEMVFTMIAGVVAVTFITFVFVPHWTGAVLVCPLITILYINMLGLMNFLGLRINGMTYLCIVVCIGLLVDFLIHILLRYYECLPGKTRNERVKETLETMGASILIGGATTFLAVVPISLSSVTIFMTVFNAFFAMVSLGVTHGLILLPVILSLVGPTTNVRHLGTHSKDDKDESDAAKEELPDIANYPTFKTMVCSGSMNEESEVDVDDMKSLTDSVVQEVCETNVQIEGSPTKTEISC